MKLLLVYIPTTAKILQNTIHLRCDRFCENNFLKLLISSEFIIEGRFLIYGRRDGVNIP